MAKLGHIRVPTHIAAEGKLWFEVITISMDSAPVIDLDQAREGEGTVRNRIYAALAGMTCLLTAVGAHADQPVHWQMGMQEAATPIMHEIRCLLYTSDAADE